MSSVPAIKIDRKISRPRPLMGGPLPSDAKRRFFGLSSLSSMVFLRFSGAEQYHTRANRANDIWNDAKSAPDGSHLRKFLKLLAMTKRFKVRIGPSHIPVLVRNVDDLS